MMTRLLFCALVVTLAQSALAPAAKACDGYGWGYGLLYNSLENRVPYFAAHPPVYYSYPVPRTYGYSPFAYPPHVMTPEVAAPSVEPLEIINPYVPSSRQEKPAEDSTAEARPESQPLVILNPFVQSQQPIAQAD